MFEFEATQSEPPLESIFLAKGGSIAAAAARGETDFALSGATEATVTKLSDEFSTVVRLPVPAGMAVANTLAANTVNVDNRTKLLVSGSRVGAGINGSLVTSVAGQGAIYLSNMMRQNTGVAAVPLTYANWLAHSAVVSTSNVRIVDATGRRYNVHFTDDKARDAALQSAEDIVGKWASGAWQMRQSSMIYPNSPTLTKSVAKVPGGINDSGFDLVHNVVEMEVPYSYETINSMMENAVQVDLEFVPDDIARFLGDTKVPGKKAAAWGRTLAASLSMLANFLVTYRADGRTRITPEGSDTIATESWLRQAPRDPSESNDCDGSAILAASIARAIVQAPKDVLSKYEYINASKNMIFPHYTIGVSVLGASGAEASSRGDAAGKVPQFAGHAATIMIDTLGLLKAMEKGSASVVGGSPVIALDQRKVVAEARFNACFSPAVLASLPEAERAELAGWDVASKLETGLTSYGIEGTTPASPVLYVSGKAFADAEKNAERDSAAFAKAAPNVGRSIKILYVGGSDAQSPHKFYHDFVEFNLGRSHPLWTDAGVRTAGVAATQIVLGKEPNRVNGNISAAGATPRDIVVGQYSAVPLVTTNGETAALLDYASEQADLHVMPPRAPVAQLDAYRSGQLTKSLAALAALDDTLKSQDDTTEGHTVAYVLAFSTLVHNALGVEHLCQRLKAVAACGMVDSLDIVGLAIDVSGAEAGKLVVINALVPIN